MTWPVIAALATLAGCMTVGGILRGRTMPDFVVPLFDLGRRLDAILFGAA